MTSKLKIKCCKVYIDKKSIAYVLPIVIISVRMGGGGERDEHMTVPGNKKIFFVIK